MKKKEEFHDALLKQYREEIETLIIESEHIYRSTIDYELLDSKIIDLLKAAHVDGISEKQIYDLISARLPSYINYKNSQSIGKKVA